MAKWSGWQDILSIKEVGTLGNGPGVYKIRLADSAKRPISIGRFLHEDKSGLLAIGESKHLAERIREFKGGWQSGRFGRHPAGDRMFLASVYKYSCLQTSHQNSILQVCVMKCANKEAAQDQEEKLLKDYFIDYGELPPLNSNLPDRKGWPKPDFAQCG